MSKKITVVPFLGLVLISKGLVSAQIQVPLYYDPGSGNLTMDATNLATGQLVGYGLSFRRGGLDPYVPGIPEFDADRFTPFMESVWTTASEFGVGDHNASGIPAGVYSLGNVLPPDLKRSTLELMAELTADSDRYGIVLDALGEGYYNTWQIIYGKSPFAPLNGDASWVPTYDRWAESVTLLYDLTNGEIAIDSTRLDSTRLDGRGGWGPLRVRFEIR